MPSEIETPHSPGFPRPKVSNPLENQFSFFEKTVAMYAFIEVTTIRSRNNSNGSSIGKTCRGPAENCGVIACIPIHRLEDAIPREARFPDPLFIAIPCRIIVAIRIITATPNSPNSVPAVDPIARRTSVD